jgi:septum formation protein
LESAGYSFDVVPADLDETVQPGEAPPGYAKRLALEKARQVQDRLRRVGDHRPVLAADTIVVVEPTATVGGERGTVVLNTAQIIGKPVNRQDASAMLQLLSGRTHQVITAYCIVGPDEEVLLASLRTDVSFVTLSSAEIATYLDRAAWHDKAGAYAIQEHAAYMVQQIVGSYTNVVGLPLSEVVAALKRILS